MEGFIRFIKFRVETPPSYGLFHLIFVAIIITATVLLCVFLKDCKEKTVRRIVFWTWLCMFILEGYKQLVYAADDSGETLAWGRQLYIFPFQLCASPLYAFPFIAFLKEGKARDCFISYCSTFVLFGGLAVVLYPGDIFTRVLGVNIQGILHHGGQVAIGVFLLVHNRKRLDFKFFLKSLITFAGFIAVACILNEIVFYAIQGQGTNEVFNMFYISPHYPCTLPILSTIYPLVPYPVFLLIYVLGFVLVSAIVFYSAFGIYKLVLKFSKKATK